MECERDEITCALKKIEESLNMEYKSVSEISLMVKKIEDSCTKLDLSFNDLENRIQIISDEQSILKADIRVMSQVQSLIGMKLGFSAQNS